MKKHLLAICILLLGLGLGRANACNNSDMSISSCVYNTGTSQWDITLHVNIGSGVTGVTTGGDQRTTTIGFFFYWSCWDSIYSFSPASITGTYTNCTMYGQLSFLPTFQGSQAHVRYLLGGSPCSATNPFACITTTAQCGPARSDPYDFTFHMATIPDSIRLGGVEGAGNYIGGCSMQPDMLADFRHLFCPPNQQVIVNNACSATLPDYRSLTSSVSPCNMGPATGLTQTPAPGTVLTAAGLSPLTMSATFPTGYVGTCNFTVMALDTTHPTITCPGNAAISLGNNCQIPMPSYAAQVTFADNCAVTAAQTPAAGTLFSGASTVQYVATDASGNTASCAFTVTAVDNIAPAVTCPPTSVLALGLTCQATLPSYVSSATVIDNCPSSLTWTQSPAAGSTVFGPGNITVTLTATDPAGNTGSCSFTVQRQDQTPPTLTFTVPSPLVLDNNCQVVLPDYRPQVIYNDNCGGMPLLTQSPAPGTVITSAGMVVVTITATDGAGNTAAFASTISVIDNIAPTISCPANTTLALNGNCQVSLPNYVGQATAIDNCLPTVTQSPAAGTFLTGSGSSTVTLTATDPSGNTGSCTFTVTYDDQTAPVITCPASITQSPTGLSCTDAVSWSSTATDNCGATVTSTPASGSTFALGTTTVVSEATDVAGNTSSCSFAVTILPPAITGSTISSDPNPCLGDTVTLSNATVGTGYLWSTGATTSSIDVAVSGSYWVQVALPGGCTATDTIVVTFSPDCVWPGDANDDGIADNQDVFAIGSGFGTSGPTRPGASNAWDGQPAPDWATSLPSLVNHKHTDCDGDGTIGFPDTIPLSLHFGLTHLKAAGTTAGIPLYIVPEQDSFPAGDSVFFNIYWGSANDPVMDGQGVAFMYHIDAAQIAPGTIYMRYLNSFLGNAATDLITITHPETAGSNWHIGLSRKGQAGQTGWGAIARVGFLPAQVYPLTQTLGYIPVRLSHATAVDENLDPILVAAMDDSIFIYNTVIGQQPLKPLLSWGIHPNPAASRAVLNLQLNAAAQVEATLIDLQGRPLQTILPAALAQAGATEVVIETSKLSTGMYFIRLEVDGRSVSRKFVVQH